MSDRIDGLTVAISAMTDRRAGLRLPPPCPGIRYLLLVQSASGPADDGVPPALVARPELAIIDLPGRGLSNSRNAALEQAQDPFLLFSDDDLELDPEGLLALRDALRDDPKLDLAVGWRKESLPPADHPRHRPHDLGALNAGRVCAPEFMVRMESVRRLKLRFDPRFGVGADLPSGEDYIFVTDLLRAGGKARSLPIVTGSHPHPSTGDEWRDATVMKARRAVLLRVFGWRAAAILPLYAWRHRRRFSSAGAALRFVFGWPTPPAA